MGEEGVNWESGAAGGGPQAQDKGYNEIVLGLRLRLLRRQGLCRGKETWGRAVLLLEELWWEGAHHVSRGAFPTRDGAHAPTYGHEVFTTGPLGGPLKNF